MRVRQCDEAGSRIPAGIEVCALGDYWQPDEDARSDLGDLVYRAKDCSDTAAAAELAARFVSLLALLPPAPAGVTPLVTSVPHNPNGSPCGEFPDLAAMLAHALATAGAGEYRPGLVARRHRTPRLRGVSPERRPALAEAAGYEVREPVSSRHVVLVDDVILTGSTVAAVAERLQAANAASVTAAIAAKTRLG